jgi:hypothetical protein
MVSSIKKKKQFKRRQFGSVPITIKIAAQEGCIQCKKKWFVIHPTCICKGAIANMKEMAKQIEPSTQAEVANISSGLPPASSAQLSSISSGKCTSRS